MDEKMKEMKKEDVHVNKHTKICILALYKCNRNRNSE